MSNPNPRNQWAKDVSTFFNASAASYAKEWTAPTATGEMLRVRREAVLAMLEGEDRLGDVLDVGCGSGEMAEPLRARGGRFWGTDLSWAMLADGRRRHGKEGDARFVSGQAELLPYAAASFDAVLAMGVVEYTADPERSVAEMARVLRPGGVLVFTLPHHWSPSSLWTGYVYLRVMNALRPWYLRLTRQPRPKQPVARPGERQQFRYSEHWPERHLPPDVAVEDVVFTLFRVLPTPLDRLLPALEMSLLRQLEPLGRGPLRWIGAALVIKARKQPRRGAPGDPWTRMQAAPDEQ
jgi:ubiquinone/menaquinone biosynthesis C-methylase UbiE